MLKPDPSSDGEPKEHPEILHDLGPSFDELMLLVFAGPTRESPDDTEEEAEIAAEEEQGGDRPGA